MTLPKQEDVVPLIEKGKRDPVEEQDSKNEDDEFHRIENEQELRKGK
jgi:hypothetical protein